MVTTVFVAWGLALAFDPAAGKIKGSVWWGSGMSNPQRSLTNWWIWVYEGPGTLQIQRAAASSSTQVSTYSLENLEVPAWSELHRNPLRHELALRGTFVEEARGWPRLCLVSRRQYGTYSSPATAITPYSAPGTTLPLEPLWSGLLINFALYAVAWSYILIVPGIVRRAIRTYRGVCARCGYDLHGADHEQCPECGTAVRPRTSPSL